MEKLTLRSKLLHDLLFIVWVIAGYYEQLFGYTVPEKAADMNVEIKEENGITKIYFKLPCIYEYSAYSPIDQIPRLFNHHLYYDMLPSARIPKYRASSLPHDTVESFLVNKIIPDSNYITIEIIYIDNPIAYDFIYQQAHI